MGVDLLLVFPLVQVLELELDVGGAVVVRVGAWKKISLVSENGRGDTTWERFR